MNTESESESESESEADKLLPSPKSGLRPIKSHEVINHGVENSQYFQGQGTAYTEYKEAFTGIGMSAHEALDDALDSAALSGWDTSTVVNDLSEEDDVSSVGAAEHDGDDEWAGPDDVYHYVSVLVR